MDPCMPILAVLLLAGLAPLAAAQSASDPSDWTICITNDTCPDYTWGLAEVQTRKAFADRASKGSSARSIPPGGSNATGASPSVGRAKLLLSRSASQSTSSCPRSPGASPRELRSPDPDCHAVTEPNGRLVLAK